MSKKGDLEINEIFIILLLLMGMMAAVWIAGESGYSESTQVKVTDKSTGELLDDGIEELSDYFYSTHAEGDYIIETHKWSLGNMNAPPDSIPHSENISIPLYPVLFNGRYLYEIRGFAAKVYERTDAAVPTDIECLAIFLDTSDTLDEYYANNETFEIKFYTYYKEKKFLEGCHVNSHKDAITKNGTFIRTYYMHCNLIWDGPY